MKLMKGTVCDSSVADTALKYVNQHRPLRMDDSAASNWVTAFVANLVQRQLPLETA